MRHISFALTTPQFRARTKTVTRRLGWWNLKPGEILMAVEKGQGLKKGEKVVRLGQIRIISAFGERLENMLIEPYGSEECVKEGFPGYHGAEFVKTFCDHNNCKPDVVVNRIEFEYL